MQFLLWICPNKILHVMSLIITIVLYTNDK